MTIRSGISQETGGCDGESMVSLKSESKYARQGVTVHVRIDFKRYPRITVSEGRIQPQIFTFGSDKNPFSDVEIDAYPHLPAEFGFAVTEFRISKAAVNIRKRSEEIYPPTSQGVYTKK